MFKLKPTQKFTRKVPVKTCGKEKEGQGHFNVTFEKIPSSERKQIAKDHPRDFITALLHRVVIDVTDIDVPDGYTPRELALDDEPCRGAMYKVYNEAVDGLERKN